MATKRRAKRTLDEDEMIAILEDIARNGRNAAARIAAIKTLRDMAEGEELVEDRVTSLYEVANPGRIRSKVG